MQDIIPDDSVLVRNARLAVENELKKRRVMKQPIARFNPKTCVVYMENGDGSITVLGSAMQDGRYSERRRKMNNR